ncbi:integral membrane protein [Xylariaceae sp. FL1272]|nr:integral membrane protein [Xylariaceae sp. FL1272]
MTLAPTHPEPTPSGTPEWDAWAAEDKGPAIIQACWSVIAVSTLFVIARLYVRGVIKKRLELDDYLIITSIACSYLSTALSTISVNSGDGKHFATLTTHQQEASILWTTAGFCPGVFSFGLPKLAVVVLLTRLLNPGRLHAAFLWFLGITTILVLAATVGVLVGRCQPAQAQWDFSITDKTCFSTRTLASYCIFAGSWSAFVDFYLAFYPSFVLFGLQMALKKKLVLSFALGIGSISGIVASYKTSRLYLLASPDFSYDTSDLVIWTVVEGSTIIIASSIPLLQPLFEKTFGWRVFADWYARSRHLGKVRRTYEDYSDANTKDAPDHSSSSSKRPRKKMSPYGDLEMSTIGGHNSSNEDTSALSGARTVRVAASPRYLQGADGDRWITRTTDVNITYS